MAPGTIAPEAPLFMGFSRQENWSGVPFPFPGDNVELIILNSFLINIQSPGPLSSLPMCSSDKKLLPILSPEILHNYIFTAITAIL